MTSPLKAARVGLGWTQARAIAAIAGQARALGVSIAEQASLKTMLSRWENGVGQPDRTYQRLFCLAYDRDEDELGLHVQSSDASVPRVAPIVDGDTVSYFHDVFLQHVKADNLMGPYHLVDAVRAQTTLLDQILRASPSNVRPSLTRLAYQYNEFTGWLYQDAGDPKNAMLFTDRAMDYALSSGNPTDIAYVLMRKTNISNDLVNPSHALGLSEAGMRDFEHVSARIRALVLVQRARAHAIDGDTDGCSRMIDDAYREVSDVTQSDDDTAAYCNLEYIQMEAAGCWTELGKPDLAIPIFERALSNWPLMMRRDLGLCQTRLAIVHAKAGDFHAAVDVGTSALMTAKAATSTRTLRHLSSLRGMLAPWKRDTEVSDLTHRIRELTRTT